MDEFEYFSVGKKSIIKAEKQKVLKPKPKKKSLKFSISKVIGRNFLKCSSRKIHDEIILEILQKKILICTYPRSIFT